LTQWTDWVKPGGFLLLTVPAFSSLWGINDELSHHYRRYRRRDILKLLCSLPLEIERLSYMNSLLFLPVWFSRNIKDRFQQTFSAFDLPSPWLNHVLKALFAWEKHWLPHRPLPWGTSLVTVFRKP